VKIQNNNIPFLTCPGGVHFGANLSTGSASAAQIRGYIASIEGYLWHKNDGVADGFRDRLQTIKDDQQLKHWLNQRDTPHTAYVPVPMTIGLAILTQLRQLDHIALDIKEAAGHAYLCTPVTQNVARTLTRTTNSERAFLATAINRFEEDSCAPNQAPIQTVAHEDPPNTTYRIDRENLSTVGTTQYWTYRLQSGGNVHGGILMEVNVSFPIAQLQQAFTNSLQSTPVKAPNQSANANGFYVQISAPQWLRDIIAA
jgi:hypothetical protein